MRWIFSKKRSSWFLILMCFLGMGHFSLAEESLEYKTKEYKTKEYSILEDISPSAIDYQKIKRWMKDNNITNKKFLVGSLKDSPFSALLGHPVLMFNSQSEEAHHVSPETPRAILHSGRLFVGLSGHLGAEEDVPLFDWNPKTHHFEPHLIEFRNGSVTFVDKPTSCSGCHGSPFRPIWGNYSTWIGAYGSDSDRIQFGYDKKGSSRAAFSRPAEKEYENYNSFLKQNRDKGIYAHFRIPEASEVEKEAPSLRLTFHLYHLHYKSLLREVFCGKPLTSEQKSALRLVLKTKSDDLDIHIEKSVMDALSGTPQLVPKSLDDFKKQFTRYQERYNTRLFREFKVGTVEDEKGYYSKYAKMLQHNGAKTDGLSYEDYARKLLADNEKKEREKRIYSDSWYLERNVRRYALIAYILQANVNVASWFIEYSPDTGARNLLFNAGAGNGRDSHLFEEQLLDAVNYGYTCPENTGTGDNPRNNRNH